MQARCEFVDLIQTACMESTDSLVNSSNHKGSARFRSLFLQRVCRSAVTVHNKLRFSCHQPTVVGMYMFSYHFQAIHHVFLNSLILLLLLFLDSL